nr:uncharacterized protein LOC113459112 [Zonotrichia albicollis]
MPFLFFLATCCQEGASSSEMLHVEGFQTVKISLPVCCVPQYQALKYLNTVFHQGSTDLTLSRMDAQLSSLINLCSAEDHTDPKVTFCHPEELWASDVTCSCKKGQVGLAACPKATVHPGTADLQPVLSSRLSRKHKSGIKTSQDTVGKTITFPLGAVRLLELSCPVENPLSSLGSCTHPYIFSCFLLELALSRYSAQKEKSMAESDFWALLSFCVTTP